MRTNSKIVREQIRQHILDCVTDNEYNDFKQAADRVKAEFEMVANYPYNMQRFPNNQDRFSDYLCGLPFNFHFNYYDIQQYLNGLGINPDGQEYSNDKSMRLYHYLIFREIFN